MNEHHIVVTADMDHYAIVFFEGLLPVSVIIFPADGLEPIGRALEKRHPNQATTLQLTRVNYRRLMREADRFAPLGVRTFDLRPVASS